MIIKNEIKFLDNQHMEFYYNIVNKYSLDCYSKSVVYLLGLTKETRINFKKIYDINQREIITECLNNKWQTAISNLITRLAFNLFNNFCYTDDYEVSEFYTVSNIFSYNNKFAIYFFQAICIRFKIKLEGV